MKDLHDRLLAAHTAHDYTSLVGLYREASLAVKDSRAAVFYMTHAYVFALEVGHVDAPALRAELIAQGRETPI
jgi:hypothetical protein